MTEKMDKKIDKDKISTPELHFSLQALGQISLIKENDYTLANKSFRIKITGKGCDGFKYSTAFTEEIPEDFKILVGEKKIPVLLDPFTAFYLQRGEVDYFHDFETDQEGFVVSNYDQENFHGKFWKDAPELIPPQMNP